MTLSYSPYSVGVTSSVTRSAPAYTSSLSSHAPASAAASTTARRSLAGMMRPVGLLGFTTVTSLVPGFTAAVSSSRSSAQPRSRLSANVLRRRPVFCARPQNCW